MSLRRLCLFLEILIRKLKMGKTESTEDLIFRLSILGKLILKLKQVTQGNSSEKSLLNLSLNFPVKTSSNRKPHLNTTAKHAGVIS